MDSSFTGESDPRGPQQILLPGSILQNWRKHDTRKHFAWVVYKQWPWPRENWSFTAFHSKLTSIYENVPLVFLMDVLFFFYISAYFMFPYLIDYFFLFSLLLAFFAWNRSKAGTTGAADAANGNRTKANSKVAPRSTSVAAWLLPEGSRQPAS